MLGNLSEWTADYHGSYDCDANQGADELDGKHLRMDWTEMARSQRRVIGGSFLTNEMVTSALEKTQPLTSRPRDGLSGSNPPQ